MGKQTRHLAMHRNNSVILGPHPDHDQDQKGSDVPVFSHCFLFPNRPPAFTSGGSLPKGPCEARV